MAETSTLDLVRLLKTGDEVAFSRIYNEYWDRLYYLAYQKLKCPYKAEEIVQEVFLSLWRKRETLRIESLPSYLAAMVRHAVYRHILNEQSLKRREFIFQNRQERYFSLDKKIEDRYILEKLLELSNELPEKCRLVFQSNKLEDQSIADIARQLNISRRTAEGHLLKALKFIRLSMRRYMSLFFFF